MALSPLTDSCLVPQVCSAWHLHWKSFPPLNSFVLLLLPCTPLPPLRRMLLSASWASVSSKCWWNKNEAALFKDLKSSKALYALAPLPSTLGPFPSQLAISCILTPSQSLTQTMGDWYLPFWTHFSSAISKATVVSFWGIPHLEELMVLAIFCFLLVSSLQIPS